MTAAVTLADRILLPGRADTVRAALDDVPAVIECIPGASITRRDPDGTYGATIGVQYGETGVRLSGSVEVDPVSADEIVVRARGQDGVGSVRAEGRIRLALAPGEAGTVVDLDAEFTFGGVLAPLARSATRIVGPQLLRSFGRCLASRVAERTG